MIARIWHGITRASDAEVYRQYVIETGVREYAETEGSLGIQIWQQAKDDNSHIWAVTWWKDYGSIEQFAGKEIQKAKYYDEDKKYLLEFEPEVIHAEVYDFSRQQVKSFIRQVMQVYEGGSWQGESLLNKLDKVNDQLAFVNPLPGVHSVGELVWHIVFWRNAIIRRLKGEAAADATIESEDNWRSISKLQEMGWKNILKALDDSQKDLIALLETKNDNDLQKEFKDGEDYAYLVEGAIHHDIYHLGQIGLVLKMIREKKQN